MGGGQYSLFESETKQERRTVRQSAIKHGIPLKSVKLVLKTTIQYKTESSSRLLKFTKLRGLIRVFWS
jgi:hypothetical protein